ncbi:MAG: dephospho-CoA kinase [Gammaproteobacteria bacterium]|nr:dephospho-CoA kinase [Gammaproteobacteria bacterium]
MSKFSVGLIGGIGSGKSTVANLFAELGVCLVDADIIAREVVEPNTVALKKIIERFGEKILKTDGSLNRKGLRDIIFQDNKARLWLEDLLHPLIREQINTQAQSALSPYCIVIIPLLKKRQDYPILNKVLLVDASLSTQISRIMQRDQVNEAQAKAIIAAQVPRSERLKLADDIIINDGHIDTLRYETNKLHQFYCQLFSA